MKLDSDNAFALYRHFVQERHAIYLQRQSGFEQPWTVDPVLASQKFTNVFRVLDPGSQFVFELDTPDRGDLIACLVFYRMTNLPSTWRAIYDSLGRFPTVDDFLEMDLLVEAIKAHRDAGNKVFSGAYIIIPEPGTANDKVEGAVRATRAFVRNLLPLFFRAKTQKQRFDTLVATPGIGKFLAMQILTDWGYLQDVNRENDFIVAGPGAKRGAARLSDRPAEVVIGDLTEMWKVDGNVRLGNYTPSLMDVQNTLCEFGKFCRWVVDGKVYVDRPYRPAHPGPQPVPTLPMWAYHLI